MVMAANNSSHAYIGLCRKHPTRLGQLMGPIGFRRPKPGVAFALDNDAYGDWTNNRPFNYPAWVGMLDKVRATGSIPLWAAVPDVVADRKATLSAWERFAPVARCYGWPLAFVVQDGMQPKDVPSGASVVFVGGTTTWKWRSLGMWVESFPRVHVGRVRTRMLHRCDQLGVESVDGTGWFRETTQGRPFKQLLAWLEPTESQMELGNIPFA